MCYVLGVGDKLVNGKLPTLKDIDDLSKQLKQVLFNIEVQIVEIDNKFNSIEQEFMYGNITESFYYEKMNTLAKDIEMVRIRLAKIENLENNST